jgi:3-oxoadipate enol-lactonase
MPALLTHVVAGTGVPIVLLNGGLMSYGAWDPVAARLERDFRVVRCDFRGQLLSPGAVPPALDGHAADVLALLDHLGIERAHVAGTSFGAFVGLTIAAIAPARVVSLVAITATDRVTPEMSAAAGALRAACQAAARGADGGVVFDHIVPATFSPVFRERYAVELAARRQVVASLPRAWFASLDALLAPLEGLDLRPLLSRVSCRTLVLAGEHDFTFPVPHSRALADALPDGRLQVVAAGSHAMVLENPAAVAEAIRSLVTTPDGHGAPHSPAGS